MGCVSSNFLEDEEGGGGIVGPGLGHHIVSLTSTTYGLLTTLDQPPQPPNHTSPTSPPPPPPPPPSLPPSPLTRLPLRSEPEVINSWELMAGLDPTTTPSPTTPLLLQPLKDSDSQSSTCSSPFPGKENTNSNSDSKGPLPCFASFSPHCKTNVLRPSNACHAPTRPSCCYTLELFERRCPPGGEKAAVIYTTTLRGIRKTFEHCNSIRAALDGLGVWFKERDVSMDMGFREELRSLMKGIASADEPATVPRMFVRGRYIGGAEEVLRIHEEGGLGKLLEGLPRSRPGEACDGCGGVRFLPCFRCSGGRKVVVLAAGGGGVEGEKGGRVVRCSECNENGLVLCPICC